MRQLRFDYPLKELPGVRVDAISDDAVFEVLTGTRDARRLRASFMEMARVAERTPERRIILVLDEPEITTVRLHDEWNAAARVLRPELFDRITMFVRHAEEWLGVRRS